MKMLKIIACLFAVLSAMPEIAMAQATATGSVTATVKNTWGATISGASTSCDGCTYSTSVPLTISNNSSGQYVTVANTQGLSYSSYVRYAVGSGGKSYGCQFVIPSSQYQNGVCTTVNPTGVAFEGVYPNPSCGATVSSGPTAPSCNYAVTFTMTN